MRIACLLILLSAPVLAEDWKPLDDTGIRLALTARVLAYPDGASQNFFADGRTLYEVPTGTSWGKWWATGGQYCSTWPPNTTPSCFGVHVNGLQVRFTGTGTGSGTGIGGEQTVGTYVDLN